MCIDMIEHEAIRTGASFVKAIDIAGTMAVKFDNN